MNGHKSNGYVHTSISTEKSALLVKIAITVIVIINTGITKSSFKKSTMITLTTTITKYVKNSHKAKKKANWHLNIRHLN